MLNRIFDKFSIGASFLLGVLLKNGRLDAPTSKATVLSCSPRRHHVHNIDSIKARNTLVTGGCTRVWFIHNSPLNMIVLRKKNKFMEGPKPILNTSERYQASYLSHSKFLNKRSLLKSRSLINVCVCFSQNSSLSQY